MVTQSKNISGSKVSIGRQFLTEKPLHHGYQYCGVMPTQAGSIRSLRLLRICTSRLLMTNKNYSGTSEINIVCSL
jgi:ribosomal protein L30/L7E